MTPSGHVMVVVFCMAGPLVVGGRGAGSGLVSAPGPDPAGKVV